MIFVKYPEPGRVKTRLAQDLGKQRAAEIYKGIAENVILRLSKSSNYKTIIFFDPPEMEKGVRNWLGGDGNRFFPQGGDSLGIKMLNALKQVFINGASRAVIIGSDCIEISEDIVSQAFKALNVVDVVIGPAEDGGYYLLGLKRLIPEIFYDIEWSTELVLHQTIKRLKANQLNFKLLKTLKDVDHSGDLSHDIILKIQKRQTEAC